MRAGWRTCLSGIELYGMLQFRFGEPATDDARSARTVLAPGSPLRRRLLERGSLEGVRPGVRDAVGSAQSAIEPKLIEVRAQHGHFSWS